MRSSGTKKDAGGTPLGLAAVLAALSAGPATIAATAPHGPPRTLAIILMGTLWIWSFLLVGSHLKPTWLTWPTRKGLTKHWPFRHYLDHRYGKLVPLAMEQRVVNGDSHWFWMCPYCGHENEGGEKCGQCEAIFNDARFRAKAA